MDPNQKALLEFFGIGGLVILGIIILIGVALYYVL